MSLMIKLFLILLILCLTAPKASAGHMDTKARLKTLLERAKARKSKQAPRAIEQPEPMQESVDLISPPSPEPISTPIENIEPEFKPIVPAQAIENIPEPEKTIIQEIPKAPVENNINIDIDIDAYKGSSSEASSNPYIIEEKPIIQKEAARVNSTKDLEDKIQTIEVIPAAPAPKTEIKTINTPKPSPVVDMASPMYEEKQESISTPVTNNSNITTSEQTIEKDTTTETQKEEKWENPNQDNHLLVIRESLKSIEEDSWTKVRTNMNEALSYFAKEKKLDPRNKDIDVYGNIIRAFRSFSEGGLELDKGDMANFEEAEARYLDAQDILMDVQDKLTGTKHEEAIADVVDTALQYVDEELDYINEMLTI